MTRESYIEKRVCAAAKAHGWLVHPKAAHGTRHTGLAGSDIL